MKILFLNDHPLNHTNPIESDPDGNGDFQNSCAEDEFERVYGLGIPFLGH